MAAVAVLASCAPRGFRGGLDEIRAEIQALERSIPPEAPLWPDKGENAFNRYIEDYTPRIPDFVYDHVSLKLAGMSEGEIENLVQPKFDLEELTSNPTAARGKVWRVSGHIANLTAQKYAVEGKVATREVFQGAIFIEGKPVLFHLVRKPDVVYLGTDEVDFSGVFVKILTYQSQGGITVSAPFFMAKSLRKYY
ncbi:MAG TPA: hypothetical protein VGK61_07515 [Planctomycetota bacterium]